MSTENTLGNQRAAGGGAVRRFVMGVFVLECCVLGAQRRLGGSRTRASARTSGYSLIKS